MKDDELKNIDTEDIEDLLAKVETSFDIRFIDNELNHITTFGQFCDHIANKIQLNHSEDCTSQQAFYKLRNGIISTLQLDKRVITTDLLLADLFPRHSRRSQIKKLENKIGFKLHILSPPHWVTGTLIILLFTSVFGFLFNWQIGLSGLVFSIIGLWFAYKIGKEFDLQTVGQVAEKMTRENYLQSRRNPNTFNKNEIEKILTDWFSISFHLYKGKLTRESKFL